MDRTYSLRQMAGLTATTTDESTVESTFQVLRGWANRGIIAGERIGTGKTSPIAYTLGDVCLSAILLTLRQSLGVEGEALREMRGRIAQHRKARLGFGTEDDYEADFPHLIEAVSRGDDWRLRVGIVRNKGTGEIGHSIQYGPVRALEERIYSERDVLALIGVLELHLPELLRPVLDAANA